MNGQSPGPSDYPLLLWPQAASADAVQSDHLIWSFTLLTLVLTVPIFLSIAWFAFHFRAGKEAHRQYSDKRSRLLEVSWMLIPFLLTLGFFYWGAKLFDRHKHAPANALRIEAIGRQWMWKFQHPGGQAEINDLHVPTGQPILINMISQDVIHALYLPALRIQMETLPGRYTQLWFKADKPGVYRLYCSEYCGTDHSKMDGLLTIMTPTDYSNWLRRSGNSTSLASQGKMLFSSYGCAGCHDQGSVVRAPSLAGLFGSPVPLEAGGTLIAGDGYIRDKILYPDHNLIAGYKQVMPSFKGVVQEGDLVLLTAYIKSLPAPGAAGSTPGPEKTQ
ncbi:cytochrome c oxidase subunit II [Lichenicola cladoniae]|uniref:cytochrome-c oxidase n=1 Tax=Lichenicola cladoniae TaxID=1484109 RepID=A0A6M8HVH0_9PROT|nr:cytochrome c oxidase subunit II [Lichenicola cladoniae]NPD69496.1 cytochrome c oxidase subunit II [Acetobacteraceae bacterium]QKE92137.1 cytochrome c oxidase subunit II [Lichenicola cladoniae]